MPLPPLVKQLAEKKLLAYCQRKIPAHLHNEIRLNFKFRRCIFGYSGSDQGK